LTSRELLLPDHKSGACAVMAFAQELLMSIFRNQRSRGASIAGYFPIMRRQQRGQLI
jgi:hypothetical protein